MIKVNELLNVCASRRQTTKAFHSNSTPSIADKAIMINSTSSASMNHKVTTTSFPKLTTSPVILTPKLKMKKVAKAPFISRILFDLKLRYNRPPISNVTPHVAKTNGAYCCMVICNSSKTLLPILLHVPIIRVSVLNKNA